MSSHILSNPRPASCTLAESAIMLFDAHVYELQAANASNLRLAEKSNISWWRLSSSNSVITSFVCSTYYAIHTMCKTGLTGTEAVQKVRLHNEANEGEV